MFGRNLSADSSGQILVINCAAVYQREESMSLLSLLTQSMSSQSSVNSLAKKTGISDAAVKMIVSAAIPLLLKSLTKNASSQQGAASLLGALGQHKNTKALSLQIEEADADDGNKIIGHIFGDSTNDVVSQLSQQTGLDNSQVNSVLGNMAPALLSSISAATAASSAGQNANSGLQNLTQAASQASQQVQPLQSLDSKPEQQQPAGIIGGLLSGLFGGGSAAQEPVQTASAPQQASGLLDSLLGGSGSDMLGSILGGSGDDLLGSLLGGGGDDNSDDGSSLLSSLLGFKF